MIIDVLIFDYLVVIMDLFIYWLPGCDYEYVDYLDVIVNVLIIYYPFRIMVFIDYLFVLLSCSQLQLLKNKNDKRQTKNFEQEQFKNSFFSSD